MTNSPTKIVIIHDDVSEGSPLMVTLGVEFGEDNIILHKHSQAGLDYVLKNLGTKMVVLLDKNFYEGKEKSGIKVFEEIRSKTSLVHVVLTSVSDLKGFEEDELKTLINHDLFGFVKFTSSMKEITELVVKASEKLETRIDAVIEEWIMKHPPEKRNQVLIRTKDGKSYTMNDILDSIRKQSTIGIEFEKNLMQLTIQLFSMQKLKLDDK